jgi:uncharacterized repeat protein (TIGR01451 family)
MKNLLKNAARAIICLTILILFASTSATAQTSCDTRDDFFGGTPQGFEPYCNSQPTTYNIFNTAWPDTRVTCVGCHPEAASVGGTATCGNYPRYFTILFSNPVADVEIILSKKPSNLILVAQTNTGQKVTTTGNFFIPGGDITSITISVLGSAPSGTWEAGIGILYFTPQSKYAQCNCARPAIARPQPQSVSSPDWNGDGNPDWTMDVNVFDNDGLVLQNVKLGQRYMAEMLSVPYYTLETSLFSKTRGELKHNGTDAIMRSKLVDYYVFPDAEKLVVEATYKIDQLPEPSESCLTITQRYEFYKSGSGCEPSETLPCARWKPIVKYQFLGKGGETLTSLNVAQRQHFKVNGIDSTTVGLFRDCDATLDCLFGGGIIFRSKLNPLSVETESRVIAYGQSTNEWDNVHQTFMGRVSEPAELSSLFQNPGCPECAHSHWRWGANLGANFNGGHPIIPQGSSQDLRFAIARYHGGEEHPNDYRDLLGPSPESIRNYDTNGRDPLQVWLYGSAPEDVVLWYSATGHKSADTFFVHGGFFNPSSPNITVIPGRVASPAAGVSKMGTLASNDLNGQDGPTSVTFADLYESGPTTFTEIDPNTVGPLPPGYAAYNNVGYDLRTEATVSGPHAVAFEVSSISDSAVFANLRIYHAEPDPLDPTKAIWVDRTGLPPYSPAPDFSTKTINARANEIGIFVVAVLTQPQPPSGEAELAVTSSDSPDPVVAGNDLTYTINVTNNGPQMATGVTLVDGLSPSLSLTSATSGQGNCQEVDGNVICRLDDIDSGASASVILVVKPTERGVRLPPEGETITNIVSVKSDQIDTDLSNNSATKNTTVLPNPNAAPTVMITSPQVGALFVGPANISIASTADDSDGSITQVDFYDDGNLIGAGTAAAGSSQYTFVWNNVAAGNHSLVAVATDNNGAKTASSPVNIIVNGLATVSITSPAGGTVFNRPASFTITANASHSIGLSKVDFYANGALIGTGTLAGTNQYSINWSGVPSGVYALTAMATDNTGLTTTSDSVNVMVNTPPIVSLTSPANGSQYSRSGNVTLTADAHDGDGEGTIIKVEFYASGALIGTRNGTGVNLYTYIWTNIPSGNFAMTAVAIDNLGARTTSNAVNISVNAPPTVSIASPTTGTQYTAPANNITITANATDGDGSVSRVEFFAGGNRIGTGTASGTNQYSFTWSNVAIGSYVLKAIATDNRGATTTSTADITVKVFIPALFVTGSTTLSASDNAVKNQLTALGYVVTVKDGASATSADATGKAVVVISSTVTPTSVSTKFRSVAVPVVLWESGLYADMGMTSKTSSNYGTTTNQTQVSITDPTHPLANGNAGTVSVVNTSGALSWGKPSANAVLVATIVGAADRKAIFGYETGAVMPGLIAPARRVGLFLSDNTAATLSTNGWALFNAAIWWATGTASLSGSLTASPTGTPVNLTAEGLKDWAHWGVGGATTFDTKAGGITRQISNYRLLGTTSPSWFADCPTTFSWTDGTPTISKTGTATGINVSGTTGNGFEITVPADTNLRTLKLYVGVWYTQGKLEAKLTDGSAVAYIDTSLNNNAGASFGLYTIQYKAATGPQTLIIRYTVLSTYFPPYGNVALEAATLR